MLGKLRSHLLLVVALLGGIFVLTFSFSNHAYADSATLIGMINNGDIYVKSGSTTAPWTTRLTTGEGASQLQMYGSRVAFIDSSNNLWLKQDLMAPWMKETTNVQSYSLTEDGLLVLQYGGNVMYKFGEGPNGPWDSDLIANDGAQVYLSPSQMVIINTSGNLLGKELVALDGVMPEGSDGAWYQIAQNATSVAVSDNILAYIDNGENIREKEGPIWSSWANNGDITVDYASQVGVNNKTLCYIYSDPVNYYTRLACAPPGTFQYNESIGIWDPRTYNFSIDPSQIILNGTLSGGNTYFYGQDYPSALSNPGNFTSSQNWNIESSTATEMTTNQE